MVTHKWSHCWHGPFSVGNTDKLTLLVKAVEQSPKRLTLLYPPFSYFVQIPTKGNGLHWIMEKSSESWQGLFSPPPLMRLRTGSSGCSGCTEISTPAVKDWSPSLVCRPPPNEGYLKFTNGPKVDFETFPRLSSFISFLMVVKRRFLADKTIISLCIEKVQRFFTSSNCSTASRFTGPSARIDVPSLWLALWTAGLSRVTRLLIGFVSSFDILPSDYKRRRKHNNLSFFQPQPWPDYVSPSFCLRAWSRLRMSFRLTFQIFLIQIRRINPWFNSVFSWLAVFNWF